MPVNIQKSPAADYVSGLLSGHAQRVQAGDPGQQAAIAGQLGLRAEEEITRRQLGQRRMELQVGQRAEKKRLAADIAQNQAELEVEREKIEAGERAGRRAVAGQVDVARVTAETSKYVADTEKETRLAEGELRLKQFGSFGDQRAAALNLWNRQQAVTEKTYHRAMITNYVAGLQGVYRAANEAELLKALNEQASKIAEAQASNVQGTKMTEQELTNFNAGVGSWMSAKMNSLYRMEDGKRTVSVPTLEGTAQDLLGSVDPRLASIIDKAIKQNAGTGTPLSLGAIADSFKREYGQSLSPEDINVIYEKIGALQTWLGNTSADDLMGMMNLERFKARLGVAGTTKALRQELSGRIEQYRAQMLQVFGVSRSAFQSTFGKELTSKRATDDLAKVYAGFLDGQRISREEVVATLKAMIRYHLAQAGIDSPEIEAALAGRAAGIPTPATGAPPAPPGARARTMAQRIDPNNPFLRRVALNEMR